MSSASAVVLSMLAFRLRHSSSNIRQADWRDANISRSFDWIYCTLIISLLEYAVHLLLHYKHEKVNILHAINVII